MKFLLKTYGCKVNQYDSQIIRENLVSNGCRETDCVYDADMCIVNTCTVTAKADKDCRMFLRGLVKKNQKARIIAAGCYAQSDPEGIRKAGKRIEIADNNKKFEPETYFNEHRIFSKNSISSFRGHTKAFIRVQDGCDNFCSYCIIPFVRGRSRSRLTGEILKEARVLVDNGYKELVLTGICLGDFGKSSAGSGTNLSGLIKNISDIPGNFRIRLSPIELEYVTDELIDALKNLKKACRHLHIPLQSGDDNVLKRMNRRYSSSDFITRIQYIRSMLPDIGITTDVITGFPGETEPEFVNTINTLKEVMPLRTHVFTYSPRPQTAAYNLKYDLPAPVIKSRSELLKIIAIDLGDEFRQKSLRNEQRVLVENSRDLKTNMLCGYTDNYIKVFLEGSDSMMGSFTKYRQNAFL